MKEIFRWTHVKDKNELEAFYMSIIPTIRKAARDCGYAIGVHGSLRRDLDLMAIPWSEPCSDKEFLARAIHRAACGIENQTYAWEMKPFGRMAVCFPVCFPEWNEVSLGHIDLSIMGLAEDRPYINQEELKARLGPTISEQLAASEDNPSTEVLKK